GVADRIVAVAVEARYRLASEHRERRAPVGVVVRADEVDGARAAPQPVRERQPPALALAARPILPAIVAEARGAAVHDPRPDRPLAARVAVEVAEVAAAHR